MQADAVEDLPAALAALRKALRAELRDTERARKALDALNAAHGLERLEVLAAHVDAIRDADLSPWGLDGQRAELATQLIALRERKRAQARATLLRALSAGAEARGDRLTVLSEAPLTVLIAPLTAVIDLAKGEAEIQYARDTITTTEAAAPKIIEACASARAQVLDDAIPSADFFELLRKAYRTTVIARGVRTGERVDLVDLLHPLALLRAGVAGWHKTPLTKIAPYPRYLLSYQLHRLRRDHALQTAGERVELGTATGGSTRDKRRVLFIPTSPTDGQYHLSIRFIPA